MLTREDQRRLAMGLVPPDRVISLTGKQLRGLQGPYVYQWCRETEEDGGRSFYLGVKTGRGERPFDPEHHVLGLAAGRDVRPDDTLHIYPMPTPNVARWAEKVFIETYPQELNQQRQFCDTWTQFRVEPGELQAGLEMAQLT